MVKCLVIAVFWQQFYAVLSKRYPCWPSEFKWSHAGILQNGYTCTHILESAEPYENSWYNNYLCVKSGPELIDPGLKFSTTGPLPGMRCTKIEEPSDRYFWTNNYICVPTSAPYSFTWSYNGCTKGKYCVKWFEPSTPSSFTWNDNYLCQAETTGSCESVTTDAAVTCAGCYGNAMHWLIYAIVFFICKVFM
ncbi:uncharacterized protein LOC130635963 [Hydractinia symbiolongicarpus]|uniref:uncharacterized protein LOC130635963 n=1 Tax=Hydractinia symbiolongicarpus TaxID=13093 RepID=UPI002550230E|nr:uncharacterized protein LOC130635963 [Hydractinia symbiolongicarpus]